MVEELARLGIWRGLLGVAAAAGDPAIYVAQPYGGMDPAQMEGYLTYYYEYHFLYITGLDHVESKSIQGAALMKLVFHEGTNMSQAMSETVGCVNRARVFMPLGTVRPFGGNQRTIVVMLDPDKLRQYQISPEEAIAAVGKATLVMPERKLRRVF